MRVSRYFLPLLKEDPKEAEIISHRLMLRSGMIRQESAGIYSWLPLGLRVLRRIERVIREEQERAGAIEILMPTIQSADLWRRSGRYDGYGKEMLRIRDRGDREILYGPTNEEMVTDIVGSSSRTYKDFPLNLFHIQWKFRDEIRPRFGVMRGREFLMKDGYSFDLTAEGGRRSYNSMLLSYLRTFRRLGLTAIPMSAEAGPIGGDLSHEFLILADTGESEVWFDRAAADFVAGEGEGAIDVLSDEATRLYDDPEGLSRFVETLTGFYAASDDERDESEFERRVPSSRRSRGRGVEVGHVFFFGDKYTRPLGCSVRNAEGDDVHLLSGSYGIGVSRLAAAVIEASHDERGIVWSKEASPFDVGLVNVRPDGGEGDRLCDDLERRLVSAGAEVLYDDTSERAGRKFASMDLLGIPMQLIVGPKSLAEGKVELKRRVDGFSESVSPQEAVARLSSKD